MTTLRPNRCLSCVHLNRDGPVTRRCTEFDEIPIDIWSGKDNHSVSRGGEQTYELMPGLESLAEAWERSREDA